MKSYKKRIAVIVLAAGVLGANFLCRVIYNRMEYYTSFPLMLDPPMQKQIGPDDGANMFAFAGHFFVFMLVVAPAFFYLLIPCMDRKNSIGATVLTSVSGTIGFAMLYFGSLALELVLRSAPFIGVPG